MPDLSELAWAQLVTVIAALIAVAGTIAAAWLNHDSDRAIRRRIAKDLATWKELPAGNGAHAPRDDARIPALELRGT